MDEQPPVIPPPPPDAPSEPTPFYRRGWFIALVGVVLLLVLIGTCGDDAGTGDSTTTTLGSSTTSADSATTSTPDDTDSTAPTTTAATTSTTAPPTTVAAGWEPITVEGSGDDVIEFTVPNDEPALLDIGHDGSSNFVVQTHTADNQAVDLLVNVIGPYQGTLPINFLVGEEVGLIEVQADGAWTITARPLSEEEVVTSPSSGIGDDVLVMDITSPSLDATHDGESNFVVIAWTAESQELLVNEIGQYSGTVLSPTGTVVFEINADGNWTLESS